MRAWKITLVFAAGVLAGCMAGGVPAPAREGSPPSISDGAPVHAPVAIGPPLLIDRTDLRIGTTVQYERIPSITELADLERLPGVAHVVVSLASWPTDFAPLQSLARLPSGADLIVVLPGYPPSPGAVDFWGLLQVPVRAVVVVDGPPASAGVLDDLNHMRGLERVVAQMDEPSRSGFERLQRPLSFRKVVD